MRQPPRWPPPATRTKACPRDLRKRKDASSTGAPSSMFINVAQQS
ncbi:hypothetical protein BIFDEN_02039 [Bifidobacterium dentium ATCC 27678]|nr:hypothetical protein BIFDEN_02039 [Bifidobacterium dentium ATCC 27678]